MPELLLFALERTRALGEAVAAGLGLSLAPHEEREFEWGQHKARSLTSVRGRDVFVLHSLHGEPGASANDKLCRLLFFVGALKDAGAAAVTAVVPHLCYMRKERKTKPRDPVTTRYVAQLFEAVGVDRVVTVDVHDLAAWQNAFRCRTEHLEARPLFVSRLLPLLRGAEPAVVSPDPGGFKRAQAFHAALERALGRELPPVAMVEKRRSQGVVSGQRLFGDVDGRLAVIVDDMIVGGTTLARAAAACRREGAARVLACATHGAFTAAADEALAAPELEQVLVLDAVPPFALDPSGPARQKLTLVPSAPLFAVAIRRLHEGGSLIELEEAPWPEPAQPETTPLHTPPHAPRSTGAPS